MHSERVSIVRIDLGHLGFVAALFVIAQFFRKLDSGSTAIRASVGLAYRSVEIFLTSDSLQLFLGSTKI